jgi:type VI protein secretion system component VasA
VLQLYDVTDPVAEPQAAALRGIDRRRRRHRLQARDGLGGSGARRVRRGWRCGWNSTRRSFVGNSGYLFALRAGAFFGLSVSINSFSQLVARYRQQETT